MRTSHADMTGMTTCSTHCFRLCRTMKMPHCCLQQCQQRKVRMLKTHYFKLAF